MRLRLCTISPIDIPSHGFSLLYFLTAAEGVFGKLSWSCKSFTVWPVKHIDFFGNFHKSAEKWGKERWVETIHANFY